MPYLDYAGLTRYNGKIQEQITDLKDDLSDITETVYGKNRFNINGNITEGYYLSSDGSLIADSRWNISDYCYVEGFTDVYCWYGPNGNTNTMWYTCAYDSNKEFLSYLGNNSTFALPEGTVYIRFCGVRDQIMLESGTTKTVYEEYSEKHVIITDPTLTLANTPADAKAVGESLGNIEDVLSYDATNLTLNNSKFLDGATGAITDVSSGDVYKVSNYVEINANSKVMITTQHFYGKGLYAFYDENHTFISGLNANGGETRTRLYNKIVKTPINAKYIVIGIYAESAFPEPFLFVGIKQNAKPSEIWVDKKWTVIGDSLTAYNIRTSMHYFDFVSGATGINIVNMGVSGTGYAKGDDNFMTRVLTIPTDSDVVTIFGSGNDSSAGLDLGTATDIGTETLGGVINTTIDNLYSIMPIVNLGIVTPTPWVGNMPSDNGWMERYSNLIVEICKRRSIPCLDLFHCSNLNPNSEQVRQLAYKNDDGGGVHPSEEGHKLIASRFKAFLESLLI